MYVYILYIARKFDGELNLVVRVETAKIKSTNVILHAMRNDVMHTVLFLAPSGTPQCELYV